MATEQQKRRARNLARKMADLDAKHNHEILAIREQHRQELRTIQETVATAKESARLTGQGEGRVHGAKLVRDTVLKHCGRLFEEGKDDAARAVRDVHRALPTTV